MIVVPALPKSQYSHNPLVAAAIVGLELAFAKGVADGIDAKANVVPEENPHEAAPQQTGPAPNREWDSERQDHPEQEAAIHKDHERVLEQMAAVHLRVGEAVFEEPAKMRMKQSFSRTMWIALAIRQRMMPNVRGSKLDGWPCY